MCFVLGLWLRCVARSSSFLEEEQTEQFLLAKELALDKCLLFSGFFRSEALPYVLPFSVPRSSVQVEGRRRPSSGVSWSWGERPPLSAACSSLSSSSPPTPHHSPALPRRDHRLDSTPAPPFPHQVSSATFANRPTPAAWHLRHLPLLSPTPFPSFAPRGLLRARNQCSVSRAPYSDEGDEFARRRYVRSLGFGMGGQKTAGDGGREGVKEGCWGPG